MSSSSLAFRRFAMTAASTSGNRFPSVCSLRRASSSSSAAAFRRSVFGSHPNAAAATTTTHALRFSSTNDFESGGSAAGWGDAPPTDEDASSSMGAWGDAAPPPPPPPPPAAGEGFSNNFAGDEMAEDGGGAPPPPPPPPPPSGFSSEEAAADDNVLPFLEQIKAFANAINPQGVEADEAKALLAKHVPEFSAKALGELSIRDALERYTDQLEVAPTPNGTSWVLKPTPDYANEAAAEATSGGNGSAASTSASSSSSSASSPKTQTDFDRAMSRALTDYLTEKGLSSAAQVDIEMLINKVLDADPSIKGPEHFGRSSWADLVANDLTSINVNYKLLIKERFEARGAHLFVDGDSVTKRDIDQLNSRMVLIADDSTQIVARSPASAAFTVSDIVAEKPLAPYMALEAAAQRHLDTTGIVLKDVIFVCGDTKLDFYLKHVAKAVAFPDANVYVCTPTAGDWLVSSWRNRPPVVPISPPMPLGGAPPPEEETPAEEEGGDSNNNNASANAEGGSGNAEGGSGDDASAGSQNFVDADGSPSGQEHHRDEYAYDANAV